MNLKIGIVGLPNVGKSTLFNALTRSSNAAAENFPFCTIDPNVGIVEVPDKRLYTLADIVNPEKIIPAIVEFVDIAGLVQGASKGEGLGNKFLSHIRECNAICHVLRDFGDENVHHVSGSVNPKSDWEIIVTELILADLQSIDRQRGSLEGKARSGDKQAKQDLSLLDVIESALKQENPASSIDLSEEENKAVKRFQLLTHKKFMIVANVSEDQFVGFDPEAFREKIHADPSIPIIPVCAKMEAELADLSIDESHEFLAELGVQYSGLENLIRESFDILGLESYFTAGPKEVRAWTIRKGSTAPQAAGEIHTDFEKGFIRAEVIAYKDYVQHNGEQGAKEAGKMRTEGKEYIVQDGDVMHFRFNV
ncbi:redox-regulated ATPase YchF [Candidatus Gracilibacteria bacterium]|nr:redox-regulated ATPase YchF [Candidatus Gracilibacteria bacterium]MCF7819115.1 redox-regulated ATPase YchF [Candidatus Gracilibacteria bacterium]